MGRARGRWPHLTGLVSDPAVSRRNRTLQQPARGMLEAANRSGLYSHPANNQSFPKVQTITVSELLRGKSPTMPTALLPYFQAQRRYAPSDQIHLEM